MRTGRSPRRRRTTPASSRPSPSATARSPVLRARRRPPVFRGRGHRRPRRYRGGASLLAGNSRKDQLLAFVGELVATCACLVPRAIEQVLVDRLDAGRGVLQRERRLAVVEEELVARSEAREDAHRLLQERIPDLFLCERRVVGELLPGL